MRNIEQNLAKGEVVVYKTKRHWFPLFFWPALFLLTSIAVFPKDPDSASSGLVFAFIWGLISHIIRSNSEFVITNKRIIARSEVINKRSLDILLTKVEAIHIEQGFFGKIFNYGTIVITGTGGTKSVLKNIKNPLEFYKVVQEQIDAARESK
jgi:uncharacterized membrane protein YdbT with pleckstrin-like domain